MSTPSFADARKAILTSLVALDAAGESGFEGLLRDALAEITGTAFHLSKSGPQGGSDVRSDPSNSLQVGLEAKRYRQGTRLALDQLKAKLVDSADQDRPPDVWILAATRSISATDREALTSAGDKLGLGVLVLDWPGRMHLLPDLAVLLAAAPGAVKEHLSGAALGPAFAVLRSHEAYASRLIALRAGLDAAPVGYASTAKALSNWLIEAQSSERNALSRLRGYNNLGETGVAVAARPSVHSALDLWWDEGGGSVGLLGDEGVGKTWAALSWISLRAADGRALPLTVFLSARDVEGRSPETTLARALAAQTGLKTEAFWLNRLRLWQRAGRLAPRMLLVIDGLNQNWLKKDWNAFIQPLLEDGWHGRFSVLMTCWPETWNALQGLAPLAPAARSIPVPPFSDLELEDFLAARGLSRADFSSDLLELMKVPRLSLLALQSRARLEGSGDVTAERLAYEDWRHRLERGAAQRTWSDEEFKAFVGELGKDLQASLEAPTVSRRELLDRLSRDSGHDGAALSSTLSDLVAGRWLEPADKVNHFKINAKLAPYALGLALSGDLAALDNEEAAKARMAEFLDPFKGQSLAVSIVRAAATAALLDNRVNRPVRRALLVRWLEEQNFGVRDFQAWWRLIGADPALFCDLVEDWWLDRPHGGGLTSDEVLIKGFANANDFREFSEVFVKRVIRWLGWIWVAQEDRVSPGRWVRGEVSVQRRAAEIEKRLRAWRDTPDFGLWPDLEMRDSGDVGWLAHRAVGVLSYVNVEPFVPALAAWALSRAIMQDPAQFPEVAWLLRLNTRDPDGTRAAVLDNVQRLAGLEGLYGKTAAAWLLRALGDAKSAVRAEVIEKELGERYFRPEEHVRPADADPVLDPARVVTRAGPDKLVAASLWSGQRQVTDADAHFDELELTLARSDPERLRAVIGEAARSAARRSVEELDGLVRQIPGLLLSLDAEEREALACAIDAGIDSPFEAASEPPPERNRRWRTMRVLLRVWNQPFETQLDQIIRSGFDAEIVSRIGEALVAPAEDAIALTIASLPTDGDPALMLGVLAYVSEIDLGEYLTTWAPLETLVLSEDLTTRDLALRLASESRNAAALRAFESTGWRSSAEAGREDRAYGSMALLAASRVFSKPELMSRVDPEIWGWTLPGEADDPVVIAGFHAFVKDRVEDLDRKGSRSFPQYAWNLDRAVKILVEKDGEQVLHWFRPWLETHSSATASGVYESFPLVDLCRAFLRQSPEDGVRLWEALKEGARQGFMKNAAVPWLPVGMNAEAMPEHVASSMLDDLTTDEKLCSFVVTAVRNDQTEWLSAVIRDDIQSNQVRRQARGWRLLGYCDAAAPFADLWNELEPPSHGWLAEVVSLARAEYDRNLWSRHWRQTLIEAATPAEAFAAYRLLQSAMDVRIGTWNDLIALEASPLGLVLRRFWSLNQKALKASITERRKAFEQVLYGSDIMRWTQAPWL